MLYTVKMSSSAERSLDKLPDDVAVRIMDKLELLKTQPLKRGQSVKLKGAKNTYRLRVGDYRVIYVVRKKVLLVMVIRIDRREDVYRKK